MRSTPKVSVYLPTRNRPDLVAQATDSVLKQTYQDFELLIVDDGSDDGQTQQVLEDLRRRDQRVRILQNKNSTGAPAARNLAIAAARGTFITGIDDDDLMLPKRLETLLTAPLRTYSLVCSGFYLEKNNSRNRYNNSKKIITLDAMLHRNHVDNQALTLTERMRSINGFDESLLGSQDYDAWTRIIERFGPGLRIAEATYIRRHGIAPTSISQSTKAGIGAKQYAEKHWGKMSSRHKISQRLLETIISRSDITFFDVVRALRSPNRYAGIKYWLSRQ